ncbi:hypothetical protein SO694_00076162 [Aureococcus anophagefferens]|uniref:Uncharacterized protein n=2 Tax=Aureococcus anophagefferens TaxID=44056 RepID=A0ABR1FHY0_AURAN
MMRPPCTPCRRSAPGEDLVSLRAFLDDYDSRPRERRPIYGRRDAFPAPPRASGSFDRPLVAPPAPPSLMVPAPPPPPAFDAAPAEAPARGRRPVELREFLASEEPRPSATDRVALRAFLGETKSRELVAAARAGDLGRLRAVLAWGCDVDGSDDDGPPEGEERWTALFYAVRGGRLDLVDALLDAGASVDRADLDGWTALQIAAEAGRLGCLRRLLQAGAAPDREDMDALTPLMYAAMGGHTAVCDALLDAGAHPNAVDDRGWAPLSYAARRPAARRCGACWTGRRARGAAGRADGLLSLRAARHAAGRARRAPAARRGGGRAALRSFSKRPEHWAKIDAIDAAGGWEPFCARHRRGVFRVVARACARLPEVLHALVVDYYAPPGGNF